MAASHPLKADTIENPETDIRKAFVAWAKKFPDEFYENIHKLKGWIWPGMEKNRYSVVGYYANDLVF